MRKFLVLIVLFLSSAVFPQVSPDDAKKLLEEGNARYVANGLKQKDFTKDRAEQVKGQHPYAIVLTCADSRVPPELIFDEGPGRLFVVRVAGNVVDDVVLGSIEYAAEHLNAQLLIVLGHTACGAVKATIAGGEFGKNIGSLVERISPAVEKVKAKNQDANLMLPLSIEENVELQAANALYDSYILEELKAEGKFKIIGGIYSIETGEVQFFEPALKKENVGPKGKPAKKGHEKATGTHVKPASGHEKKAEKDHSAVESGKYDFSKDRKISNTVFTDGENYCLQVSSWQSRKTAEAEARKYKKLYEGVFIMPYLDTISHKTWYRVRIGYFTSQQETEAFASKVN